MNIFKLEDYLTHYEFTAPHLLCCSDAESFAMQEIIDLGSAADRKLWDGLRLSYTEPYGSPLLRTQIVLSLYPSLKQEHILCSAGAEEAIYASLYVLSEPSDHVIVLTPCYQSLLEVPSSKGAAITTVALQESNQWRIDLDDIKKAIRPNTKCIVMNFPHNPTGQVITQSELEALANLCDAHGIWLFSDEVYRLLGTPAEPWAKPAAEVYPKAISLGVMSKAFGMAGLRIGWIACQDVALLERIKQIKDYLSICNSAPSEVISLITLKNKEKLLARNNQIVAGNLRLIDQFMVENNKLFSWVRPEGGCVGFVHYKGAEPIDAFCQRLLAAKGVLLLPALIYDHDTNHFRIGFGRSSMPSALQRLNEFIISE